MSSARQDVQNHTKKVANTATQNEYVPDGMVKGNTFQRVEDCAD